MDSYLEDGLLIAPQPHVDDLQTLSVQDPATAADFARVGLTPFELIPDIIGAAEQGQVAWASWAPRERSRVLASVGDRLRAAEDELTPLITQEMGKPLAESRTEVSFSADYFTWYAEQSVRISGEYYQTPNGNGQIITTSAPLGVAYLITPWNFPLLIAARKAAAALAAGCSIILQPSMITPLAAIKLVEMLWEAGVPRQAAQLVTADDAGKWSAAMMADHRVRKVSFTGSTRVGQILVAQSAANLQKLSLELGGDAPFIVCEDADLDTALDAAVISKIRNGGQACVSANRFLVAEGVSQEFNAELAKRLDSLKLGPGFEPDVQVGPMITKQAKENTMALVREAVEHGATSWNDVATMDKSGQYLQPLLLSDIPNSVALRGAEIFAPIAVSQTFRNDAEALQLANDTRFGLAAYLFSQNLDRAFGIAENLKTGMVGINKGLVADASGPFGGVGYSGYGREGGAEGLRDFQYTRQFNVENSKWRMN